MVKKTYAFLIANSIFLMLGAAIGLLMANLVPELYAELTHPIHFIVMDVLMALFFGKAAKEIREAMLPGGALHNPRQAALPLIATIGGMAGPAVLYAVGAWALDPTLLKGWAIPTATDIAFSALVARFVFGKNHPAIAFLLLLAVADDGGGLLILAGFYPTGEVSFLKFVLIVAGAMGLSLFMWRKLKVKSFIPYILGPGVISWVGFYLGGIHPALALVPLMWCMPHEHDDLGLYADAEEERSDALNQFSRVLHHPIEIITGLFGFVAAGVTLSSFDTGTWLVAVGLLIGKPLGITLFTALGLAIGLQLPTGMNRRDVVVLGSVAGIGFTVALFVSGVAFPEPGSVQDAAKMGALLSFGSAGVSIGLARVLRVGRWSRSS